MQLTKYKYINNQKPRFDEGTNGIQTSGQQQQSVVTNPSFSPWVLSQGYNNLPSQQFNNTANIRTVTTQSNPPAAIDNTPVTKQGVTDYMPNIPINYGTTGMTNTSGTYGNNGGGSNSGGSNGIPAQGGGFSGAMGRSGYAWGQAIQADTQAAFAIKDAFGMPVKSETELLGTAGTSTGSINGISYQRQNSIDAQQEIADERAKASREAQNVALATGAGGAATGAAVGLAIGTSAGPIGSIIGAAAGTIAGIFIGGAAKRKAMQRIRNKIANAQIKGQRINQYQTSVAQSQALQQDYYNQYGNSQGEVLYANKGKDIMPKYNSGKSTRRKVWSPDGYLNGEHNSYVGKGESIINFDQGKGTVVSKGKVGVDNQSSSVREDDNNVILGNDLDLRTGATFAQQGRPLTAQLEAINKQEKKVGKYAHLSSLNDQTVNLYNKLMGQKKQVILGQLKNISDRQAEQHEMENREQYGYYANGKSVDFLPTALGVAEGLGRYYEANRQKVYRPNTYFRNASAGQALAGLASLRYDVNPQLRDLRNALRYNKYNIDQTGGLTAGQKYIARNSMYNDYINSASRLYAAAEEQNNKYRTAYYDALMKSGQEDRQYMTNAAVRDNDAYAKAKAARQAYRDQALKDVMENIYRWDKIKTDNKRWKDTLGIYEDESKQRAADRKVKINQNRDTINALEASKKVMWYPYSTDWGHMQPIADNYYENMLNWDSPYANGFVTKYKLK